MELLERLGLYARAPDSRPMAEIRAEIDEELAFHLAECARSLAADGFDESEAQAEARRRFGDLARIRRACARTQLGERIMVQRIQLVLTSVLIAAVGVLLWSNRAARADSRAQHATSVALAQELARLGQQLDARLAPQEGNAQADALALAEARARELEARESEPRGDESGEYPATDGSKTSYERAMDSWRTEFRAQNDSWRHGLRVGERFAALPGPHGVEMLPAMWGHLSKDHRVQVMNAFVAGKGHPHAVEVLALAVGWEPNLVSHACELAQPYVMNGFRDLRCEEWLLANRERTAAEILASSATTWARELVAACSKSESADNHEILEVLYHVDHFRPELFEGAGIDFAALLEQAGVCDLELGAFGVLDADAQRRAELVLSWCKR